MDITCIFFGIAFIVCGFLFAAGKLHVHLSAWKNTPEDEKEKIDILPICRNIGIVIILCGLIFTVRGFTPFLSGKRFIIAMIVWLILAGFDVWRISKNN